MVPPNYLYPKFPAQYITAGRVFYVWGFEIREKWYKYIKIYSKAAKGNDQTYR